MTDDTTQTAQAAQPEPPGTISPWMPERDPIRLAVLGKLAEECNELAGRANRCIIQGLGECDPDSGRTNAAELAREVADVIACIKTLEEKLGIGHSALRARAKRNGFRRWHAMIEAAGTAPTAAEGALAKLLAAFPRARSDIWAMQLQRSRNAGQLGRLPSDQDFMRDFDAAAAEGKAALSARPRDGKHVLYETGDPDKPEAICDRNGEVVLACCRRCGRGESELDDQPVCDAPV